ncbi:uncharacterized protein [Argopecten irradians]|uniref:uncharacterized protein isoform X1 n=1 Tax=Argopecten irradians TaxID=31199 RepID=UPI00371A193E
MVSYYYKYFLEFMPTTYFFVSVYVAKSFYQPEVKVCFVKIYFRFRLAVLESADSQIMPDNNAEGKGAVCISEVIIEALRGFGWGSAVSGIIAGQIFYRKGYRGTDLYRTVGSITLKTAAAAGIVMGGLAAISGQSQNKNPWDQSQNKKLLDQSQNQKSWD